LDQTAFLAVNGFRAPWADLFFFWISQKWVWIPVYAWVGWLFYRREGWRGLLYYGFLTGVAILLADQAASGLLKPWVARPRPCHDPALDGLVNIVQGKCGGPYGFASSHASNFFALATLFGTWLGLSNMGKMSLFLVAGLVAYSRVYLGVHYPGDVLVGAILGVLSAILVIWLARKSQGWLKLETKV
jgi:undecaprenyl-diphosphatase